MATKLPKTYSAEFKTRVALEMIRGEKTTNEVASAYGINPSQAKRWKQKVLAGLPTLFTGNSMEYVVKGKDELIEELYKQIGQLKVEVDWVKKKFDTARK